MLYFVHVKPLITERSFYKYLKCPSWLSRDAKNGKEHEALLERLQDDGLLREKERQLLASRSFFEVVADDIDDAARKTMEAMRRGEQTIYQAVLVHGHWVARPDLLERIEGKSALGNWYYVACDMKRSSRIKDEYKFQGCFYAELLQKIQKTHPVMGYVIFPDARAEGYLLADTYAEYRLTLDGIERILEGYEEPHFLTSGCKQSPYFSECINDTKACDDLSLLNRVWRTETASLVAAGIGTVSSLAAAKPKDLARVTDLPKDRVALLYQQAVAMIEQRVIRLGAVDFPVTERALVLDVESDPLRDADYLFGVLEVTEKKQTYHSFIAKLPDAEKQAWEKFVTFAQKYPEAPIYHYGAYERDVLRRCAALHGTDPMILAALEARLVDILVRLREKIIFPIPFYSLKDIAKYLGFSWRSQDASGADSVLWYEEWLETGNEELLKEIVDYNEDDVRATWHVINWVRTG